MTQLDDLVREFLLFRGFTQTFKTFENDLKVEKERGFRVDRYTHPMHLIDLLDNLLFDFRIIDVILGHISNQDLAGLRELWAHFNQRLFSRIEGGHSQNASKLEANVLRLYVINCIQTKRVDKAKEFFEKMAPDLQGQVYKISIALG